MDTDVQWNRELNNVKVLCVKSRTKDNHSVRSYISEHLNLKDLRGIFIASNPVLFDSGGMYIGFKRFEDAVDCGILLEEEKIHGVEFIGVYLDKIDRMFTNHPRTLPIHKFYFGQLQFVESKTVSMDYTISVLRELYDLYYKPRGQQTLDGVIVGDYPMRLTLSVRDRCKAGFLPTNEMYSILKEVSPGLLNFRSPNNPSLDAKVVITKNSDDIHKQLVVDL